MKIADKIKAVIANDPEIQRRRAEFHAAGYIFKHHDNVRVQWQTKAEKPNELIFDAWECYPKTNRFREMISVLRMKALSEYKVEEPSMIASLIKKFEDMFKTETVCDAK